MMFPAALARLVVVVAEIQGKGSAVRYFAAASVMQSMMRRQLQQQQCVCVSAV